MKTLFITVSESWVTNTLLRSPFWVFLNKDRNFRIVLVVPESKADEYSSEFGGRDIKIEPIGEISLSSPERFTFFIARNALRTGMVKFVHAREYNETENPVYFFAKRVLWHVLGSLRLSRIIIRRIELFLKPHPDVKSLFDRYNPDLVFATIANYAQMDVPVLREAKRRGIKTTGMFRGWDTFVSHGFLRVVPDLLLLQNAYLRETGEDFQFLPNDIMKVIGFPQFDAHFRKDWIEPRESFFKRLGLDPQKRMILFGAMESYWFSGDGEIAEVFDELVESGKLPQDLMMLFRPYPGYVGSLERVKRLKYVKPDIDSFSLDQAGVLELREKQISHLLNSIYHSEIVVSIASTIALDGVALGRPAISAAFEKTTRPFWFSVKRFYDHCTHFMEVFKTGGVKVANSSEEFADAVNLYLKNPRADSAARAALMEKFIEPHDGKAGERIAQAILKELNPNG